MRFRDKPSSHQSPSDSSSHRLQNLMAKQREVLANAFSGTRETYDPEKEGAGRTASIERGTGRNLDALTFRRTPSIERYPLSILYGQSPEEVKRKGASAPLPFDSKHCVLPVRNRRHGLDSPLHQRASLTHALEG
jgi:hypothetical protein